MKKEQESMVNQTPGAKQEAQAGGQAVTEEQVSDVYMAGSSDGIMQLEGGKELHIPEKGYEQ